MFHVFPGEGLNDPDAGKVVLQFGIDVAQARAHLAINRPNPGVVMPKGQGQDRHRNHDQRGQAPIQHKQNDRAADQPHEVNRRQRRAVGDKVLQGAEVIGDPRHQLAGGGAFKKGEGHFLQIGIQANPQIENEFFSQCMPDIVIADLKQLIQRICAD